jgi:L,D-peptidoglycan transpeptidase YkuD (ErfK/YbiS/YcfS/YnhG family)
MIEPQITRPTRLLTGVLALAALFVVSAGTGSAARAACVPNLAGRLASTGSASQLVTVVAAARSSTTASLRLWRRQGGCWAPAAGPWQAYVGYAGVSDHHVEGDNTTPAGAFGIGPLMYGVAPDPGVHYPYHRVVCGDWWDEDSSSSTYNTFQHVPCGTRPPFGGGSEALWESVTGYAHLALIEYNTGPVVPGRGSAIFIHDNIGHPTNGCVSLPPDELVRLLRWLRPELAPVVVIGTADEIRGF